MSDYEKLAAAVLPPMEDSISAIAITTSASTVQDTGVVVNNAPRYVTFISDVAFYITFSNDGSNANITDPDGTAVSGSGRTWLVPANTQFNALVGTVQRYFKARGTASGTLRWYVSSR